MRIDKARHPVPVFLKTLARTSAGTTSYTIPVGHYAIAHFALYGATGAGCYASVDSIICIASDLASGGSIKGGMLLPEKTVVDLTATASTFITAHIEIYKQ